MSVEGGMSGTQLRIVCVNCGKVFFAWRPDTAPGAKIKCYFCKKEMEDEVAKRPRPAPPPAPAPPAATAAAAESPKSKGAAAPKLTLDLDLVHRNREIASPGLRAYSLETAPASARLPRRTRRPGRDRGNPAVACRSLAVAVRHQMFLGVLALSRSSGRRPATGAASWLSRGRYLVSNNRPGVASISAGEPGAAYCRGYAFGGRLVPWRHAAARPYGRDTGPPLRSEGTDSASFGRELGVCPRTVPPPGNAVASGRTPA